MERSNAAKARKAFRPPFKGTAKVQARVSLIPHDASDAAYPVPSNTVPTKCDKGNTPKESSAAVSPQRSSEQDSSTEDRGKRDALVEDTLHWIAAAQKAIQYLANSTANGSVGCVLAELRVDPATVLYCVKEEAFEEL